MGNEDLCCKLNLPVGAKCKPFFKTEEEQRKWFENFAKQVRPGLKEQAIARIRSAEEAIYHRVDTYSFV